MSTHENLRRIDELWGLHELRLNRGSGIGKCLAFSIGSRYVASSDDPDLFLRVGVSFGDNPFTPEMARCFLPPPVLPGLQMFGIHTVGTKGNKLALLDQWFDAQKAEDCLDIQAGMHRTSEILAMMDDQHYLVVVSESLDDRLANDRSDFDFNKCEIVAAESL